MSLGLVVDELDVLVRALLELLLEVSATVLILAERIDFALEALQRDIIEARDFCLILVIDPMLSNEATYLQLLGCVCFGCREGDCLEDDRSSLAVAVDHIQLCVVGNCAFADTSVLN